MIDNVAEFVRLCTSDIPEERRRAKTETTVESVLLGVLEQYPDMAPCVIRNNSVTIAVLEKLANSSDPEIRWWIATKRKLSPELIERLSTDDDETVRQRIAYNVKTPRSVLEVLANDASEVVSRAAQSRLGK